MDAIIVNMDNAPGDVKCKKTQEIHTVLHTCNEWEKKTLEE